MARRMTRWMVLLTLLAGCPHTWGKEGYVERLAYENYLRSTPRQPRCPLSPREWFEACGEEGDYSRTCPENCPLPGELKGRH